MEFGTMDTESLKLWLQAPRSASTSSRVCSFTCKLGCWQLGQRSLKLDKWQGLGAGTTKHHGWLKSCGVSAASRGYELSEAVNQLVSLEPNASRRIKMMYLYVDGHACKHRRAPIFTTRLNQNGYVCIYMFSHYMI